MPNVDEQAATWFEKRFGEDFTPSEPQKELVKEYWGKKVPKDKWEAAGLPKLKMDEGRKQAYEAGKVMFLTREEAAYIEENLGGVEIVINEQELAKLAEDIERAEEKRKNLFTNIMDIPEADWIVEGFAVKQGITLLYGDRHTGKTSLMLQLIGSVYENKKLLSLNIGKVKPLLIEQDESPSLLRSHVERMLPQYRCLEKLNVPTETVLWDNDKARYASPMLEDLIQYSSLANLVIIDSLTSLGIEDINHPRCSLIFDRLRDISRKWACAFIVLHHPNKSGEIMGNKLIQAKVDCILQLQKDKLIVEKLRAKTPSIFTVDGGKYPYLEVEQDPDTLIFRIDKAAFIRELLLQGKPRLDVINSVSSTYGGNKESIGKATDRQKKKLTEEGKFGS
jgi:archaellum biogenesis ATPase FlaH